MSNQQTADYALRFATFACDVAYEQKGTNLFVPSSRLAADLVEQAGYIEALAQEAQTTLNRDDPEEVEDFRANWRMGLNWWNQLVVGFMKGLDVDTQRRVEAHMEAFWGDDRG